jgi:phospholipid/cholesterol/gamma-HCH transport system permease protein
MSNGQRQGTVGEFVRKAGVAGIFFARLLIACVPAMARPRLIVAQIFNAGGRSLIIVMLSGLFTGMVLGLLGQDVLQRFGAETALGVIAALALVKELGPVLTALLFAGRAGTALTSEIGLMRTTEQLTAMEVMAVDPMSYVAAPRFIGGIIAMPLLVGVFDVIGLYGAQLMGVQFLGVDRGTFWSQMQGALGMRDVTEGIVKSLVFGVVLSLIAVNEGYHSEPTAAGVGLATTRTVVVSSVLTLFLDYVLTAVFL